VARIRTIKPEIADDEKVGNCSRDARLLFILCITIADDGGRFRAHERYLRTRLFPYDGEELTAERVGEWLAELVGVGLVVTYQVEGETFAELRGWMKHQRVDNARRLLVPPPDWAPRVNGHKEPSESLGNPRKDSEGFGEIPLEGDPGGDPLPRTLYPGVGRGGGPVRARARRPTRHAPPPQGGSPDLLTPRDFEQLWNTWPEAKRLNRQEAEVAWDLATRRVDPSEILAGATTWLHHWGTEGTPDQWITRIDRWLSNGKWREIPTTRGSSPAQARDNQAVAEVQAYLNGRHIHDT